MKSYTLRVTCASTRGIVAAISGYLAGHETIADTMADPVFADFVRGLWRDEIIPALTPPPGEDLAAYASALAARYANPAIRHRTWQIAMDGSQKLPQRIDRKSVV